MLIRRLQGIQNVFTEFKQVRNIGPDNKITFKVKYLLNYNFLAISLILMEIYANLW